MERIFTKKILLEYWIVFIYLKLFLVNKMVWKEILFYFVRINSSVQFSEKKHAGFIKKSNSLFLNRKHREILNDFSAKKYYIEVYFQNVVFKYSKSNRVTNANFRPLNVFLESVLPNK